MFEIWRYSASQWSERQADKYTDSLFDAMAALAAEPNRGRACDEIHEGLHRYVRRSHVIFYVIEDFGVEVVRVRHERMDFAAHLANDEA